MEAIAESVDPGTRVVNLDGLRFDAITAAEVVSRVCADLADGRGGKIVTPNVDIIRQVRRAREARDHVTKAAIVVADGAPLVWASRLAGTALPERVAGSDLIWSLSRAAERERRRVFLLGGAPGGARATAGLAADRLVREFPGLHVAGACSPPFGFDTDAAAMSSLAGELTAAQPDIVFVGLGFPKQERLIARLATRLPSAWFLGCGAGIDFVAGTRRRAPEWMRHGGLEWLHRLISEPRRLFVRYIIHDGPAACGLLLRSSWRGLRP